ncbi:hypothetical protein RV18_GL000312 [Enterococcus termitis]|nr:hypothetical protein RV18_GL000312 [Enterococcus termitis]
MSLVFHFGRLGFFRAFFSLSHFVSQNWFYGSKRIFQKNNRFFLKR